MSSVLFTVFRSLPEDQSFDEGQYVGTATTAGVIRRVTSTLLELTNGHRVHPEQVIHRRGMTHVTEGSFWVASRRTAGGVKTMTGWIGLPLSDHRRKGMVASFIIPQTGISYGVRPDGSLHRPYSTAWDCELEHPLHYPTERTHAGSEQMVHQPDRSFRQRRNC